jgi:hypothetical protein
MGVGELGVQVQVEVSVEGKFFISHLEVTVSTLLDDRTSINGL